MAIQKMAIVRIKNIKDYGPPKFAIHWQDECKALTFSREDGELILDLLRVHKMILERIETLEKIVFEKEDPVPEKE